MTRPICIRMPQRDVTNLLLLSTVRGLTLAELARQLLRQGMEQALREKQPEAVATR